MRKRKISDEPIRVFITEEECPSCFQPNMGATTRHLNCYNCGFQRPLLPKEIREYTGALLRQERETR